MEKKIFYVLFKGYVRLRQFLGRALRLLQARVAERCGYYRLGGRALRLLNPMNSKIGQINQK